MSDERIISSITRIDDISLVYESVWPEVAGPRHTVDIDTDDIGIIARAVKFAIDDGLPLRVDPDTPERRHEIERYAYRFGFDCEWGDRQRIGRWATVAVFTPRAGDVPA